MIFVVFVFFSTLHWRVEIWNFSSSVQLVISLVRCPHPWDIELNTRRYIPYLQATMYYFSYYIDILLTRRSRLNSHFRKGTLVLNRASDASAADWLFQTHVKSSFIVNFHGGDTVLSMKWNIQGLILRHLTNFISSKKETENL